MVHGSTYWASYIKLVCEVRLFAAAPSECNSPGGPAGGSDKSSLLMQDLAEASRARPGADEPALRSWRKAAGQDCMPASNCFLKQLTVRKRLLLRKKPIYIVELVLCPGNQRNWTM